MKISSGRHSSQAAFTLIEVLVVLLIIGISISALSGINYSPVSRNLNNTAREFTGTAQLVQEEAVLGGQYWGIDFFTRDNGEDELTGYRWVYLNDDTWQTALPSGMDEFQPFVELPSGSDLQLQVEGMDLQPEEMISLQDPGFDSENFSPEVWFYPGHEVTPFTVLFSHPEYGSLEVSADLLGRITLNDL